MDKGKAYSEHYAKKDFDEKKVDMYHKKFFTRFEKNIKHRQQIRIIKKYLHKDMDWLDAPIGSGRLMEHVKHPKNRSFGFDLSKNFLKYNEKKGIKCFEGDLFKMDLEKKFDLVTSLHTVFAFNDFRKILSNYINILASGGYLIVDIINLHLYENFSLKNKIDKKVDVNGMTLDQIHSFFSSNNCNVIEAIPHDFFDSEKILYWRLKKGSDRQIKKKKIFWKFLNQIYFKAHLFYFFDLFEDKEKIDMFNKWLVVVQKNN